MIALRILSKIGTVEVLEALSNLGKLRFADLSKFVKNPGTLSVRLMELADAGLIEREGRLYQITDQGGVALSLVKDLESTVAVRRKGFFRFEELERIPLKIFREYLRRYCELLFNHYRDRLVSIVVFGSVSRGTAKINESDIDILVVVEDWKGKLWDRIAELAGIEGELGRTTVHDLLLRWKIWPIIQNYPLSREEAEEFNRIYLDMIFEGVVLYDKDNFITLLLERLRKRLEELGSRRVQFPSGSWYWVLKPSLKAGEDLVI